MVATPAPEHLATGGAHPARDVVHWLFCDARARALRAFVAAAFDGAALREAHGLKLRFEVPARGGTSLAQLFGVLEAHRAELAIEDYAVSQTSLEQIFNSFASQQEDKLAGTIAPALAAGGPTSSSAALTQVTPAVVSIG